MFARSQVLYRDSYSVLSSRNVLHLIWRLLDGTSLLLLALALLYTSAVCTLQWRVHLYCFVHNNQGAASKFHVSRTQGTGNCKPIYSYCKSVSGLLHLPRPPQACNMVNGIWAHAQIVKRPQQEPKHWRKQDFIAPSAQGVHVAGAKHSEAITASNNQRLRQLYQTSLSSLPCRDALPSRAWRTHTGRHALRLLWPRPRPRLRMRTRCRVQLLLAPFLLLRRRR